MPSSVSCLRNEPRSRGLSLFEPPVVLTALGVSVTRALPHLSGWVRQYTPGKARRQFATDLQLARIRAGSPGVHRRVALDAAHRSYKEEQGSASKGSASVISVAVARSLSGPENPRYTRGVMVSTDFTDHLVIFSTGGTASPAGTSTFGTADYSRRASVILGGRTRSG